MLWTWSLNAASGAGSVVISLPAGSETNEGAPVVMSGS
jgi:hypothetical protein